MIRILVVDDEPSICKALTMGLTSKDFKVDVACNGNGGILVGTHKEYDILIIDLGLPDMNGLEVIRKLKCAHPEIISIVITGIGNMESSIEAIHLEVSDYLEKPFSMELVKNSITRGLEMRSLKRKRIAAALEKSEIKRKKTGQNLLNHQVKP